MTAAAWPYAYEQEAGTNLIGTFTADSGFTYSTAANAPTHEFSTLFAKSGTGTIKFTTPNNAYAEIGKTFTANLITNGRMGIWVYVPDYTKLSTITLYIGTTSYAAFFTRTFSFSNPRHQYNGWHFLQADAGEYSVGGGSPAFGSSSFVTTKIRVTPATSQTATIYFDSIWAGFKARGKVIITADDGYGASWYSTGLPILDAAGLKCSMSIIGDKIGASGYMTLAQLQTAYANGHECCVHGPVGGTGSLANYSTYADILADIDANQRFLRENGLANGVGDRTYIFPQGIWELSTNDTTILSALAALGFVVGRRASVSSTGRWVVPHFQGPANPILLPVIGHNYDVADEAANITAVLGLVDDAVKYGRTAILMFHKVVSGTPAADIEIEDTNFQTIVSRLAARQSQGLLDVVTWRQWYLGLTQPALAAS